MAGGDGFEVIVYDENSSASLRTFYIDEFAIDLSAVKQKVEGRLYRPLVDKTLWAKGIEAVENGTMSWPRLCDRFLSEVLDDEDLGTMLKGGSASWAKFGVVLVGSSTTTTAPGAAIATRFAHLRTRRPLMVTDDTDSYDDVTTTSWGDESAPVVEKRTTSSSVLVDARSSMVRRLRERSQRDVDARHCYVDALRKARIDVERLRGAQQTALLIADRDEQRLKRAFSRWVRHDQTFKGIRANRIRGAKEVFKIAKRIEARRARTTLLYLRWRATTRFGCRKGASAAVVRSLAVNRAKKNARCAFDFWKRDAATNRRRNLILSRCVARLAKTTTARNFSAWRNEAKAQSRKIFVSQQLLRHLATSWTRRALERWRTAVETLEETARRNRTLMRALAPFSAKRRPLFDRWRLAMHSARELERIAQSRRARSKNMRELRLLRSRMNHWRNVVEKSKHDEMEKRRLAHVVSRAQRRKVLGAWNAWRESDEKTSKIERCVSRNLPRSKKRDALTKWRTAVLDGSKRRRAAILVRSFMRDVDANVTECKRRGLLALYEHAHVRRTELTLVMLGACGSASNNKSRVLSQAWRRWQELSATKARYCVASQRTLIGMKRARLCAGWRRFKSATKQRGLELRSERLLKNAVLEKMRRARMREAWCSLQAANRRADNRRHLERTARRAVVALVRLRLSASWQKWLEFSRARGQQILRGKRTYSIVVRLSKHELARAMRSWSAFTIRAARRDAVLDRAARRMSRSLLARGFLSWRHSHVLVGSKLRFLARCAHKNLYAAWLSWIDGVDRLKANRVVLRRAALRAQRLELAASFSRWRWVARQLQSELITVNTWLRVDRFVERKDVARAWRRWIDGVASSRLEEARAHHAQFRRVAALKQVARRGHGDERRVAVDAWTKWCDFVEKRAARDAVGRRCLNKMIKASSAAAFRQWKLAARYGAYEKRFATKIWRIGVRLANARVARAWRTWVLDRRARDRMLLARCLSSFGIRGMCEALRKWSQVVRHEKVKAEAASRAIRRMISIKKTSAFDSWCSKSVQSRAILRKAVMRMHKTSVAAAMHQLRAAVRASALESSQKVQMKRVVAMMRSRDLSASWRLWIANSEDAKRLNGMLRRIVGSKFRRDKVNGWRSFALAVKASQVRRETMKRVLLRAGRSQQAAALDAWRASRDAADIVRSIVEKWHRLVLWQNFARWRVACRRLVDEQRLLRSVSRFTRRQLASAYKKWASTCRDSRLDEAARKLEALRRSSLIRHLLSKCGASAKMRTAQAFGAWRYSTLHVAALRRIKMRNVAGKLMHRDVAGAFRRWASQRVLFEKMGRVARRWTRRSVATSWRSWVAATNRSVAARRVLRRVVVGMRDTTLWMAWRTWLAANHRAKSRDRGLVRVRRVLSRVASDDMRRAWREWNMSVQAARSSDILRVRCEERRAGLLRLVSSKLAHVATLEKVDALRTWRAHARRCLVTSVTLRRISSRLTQLDLSRAMAAWKSATAEEMRRRDRGLRVLSASPRRASIVRWQSRAWRRWLMATIATRHNQESFAKGFSMLLRTSGKVRARRAVSVWSAATIRASCRELAARRLADVSTLRPLNKAFGTWRAEASARTSVALTIYEASRPVAVRHAACSGALCVVLNGAERRHDYETLASAFETWYADLAHDKGARILSVTLGAACDALLAAAWDTWSGASQRRAEIEYRLWQNLERRMVRNAWVHWWSQVEVTRELESLQKGVRALVRVRHYHH